MMRKLIFGVSLITLSSLAIAIFAAPFARAEDSKFKQRILPMDCVFQVINVGTGTIQYLTPEECGVNINLPQSPNTLPTSSANGQSTDNGIQSSTGSPVSGLFSYNPQKTENLRLKQQPNDFDSSQLQVNGIDTEPKKLDRTKNNKHLAITSGIIVVSLAASGLSMKIARGRRESI
jgi:hypothetical protein